MPAWGAPGGGPLTSQQIEELVAYLAAIQLTPEQMATEVKEGIRESVLSDVRNSVTDPTDEELKAAYNQLVNGLGDALENQRLVKANPESEIEQIESADNAVLALSINILMTYLKIMSLNMANTSSIIQQEQEPTLAHDAIQLALLGMPMMYLQQTLVCKD